MRKIAIEEISKIKKFLEEIIFQKTSDKTFLFFPVDLGETKTTESDLGVSMFTQTRGASEGIHKLLRYGIIFPEDSDGEIVGAYYDENAAILVDMLSLIKVAKACVDISQADEDILKELECRALPKESILFTIG